MGRNYQWVQRSGFFIYFCLHCFLFAFSLRPGPFLLNPFSFLNRATFLISRSPHESITSSINVFFWLSQKQKETNTQEIHPLHHDKFCQ
jgi:hypothetical protein